MILLPASSYPVPFSETWRELDSTKIKEFMACPRRFFYRYVLGWQLETSQESLHLIFGQAWHLAMEHLLKGLKDGEGYTPKRLQEAYDKLQACYYEAFSTDQEEAFNTAKNPSNALQALVEYSQRFAGDPKEFDVLHTEIAGTVPISDDRRLVFKIDAVCQDKETKLCYILEHKTSQTMTSNWADQWTLSVQVGTYCHALYCLMTAEQVYGAKVNGAFFRKKGNDFMRVPVRQTEQSMQRWLENINQWYDMIEENFHALSNATPTDPVMLAFPMNTESCMDWGGVCPYHDFCLSWNNPLKQAQDGAPMGYEVRHWKPLEEHLKTAQLVEV